MTKQRILQIVFGALGVALLVFVLTREPKKPALPRWEMQEELLKQAEVSRKKQLQQEADRALVKSLLMEKLNERTFDFSLVVEAASDKRVIPLKQMKSANRAVALMDAAVRRVISEMNSPESPVRDLSRINEGSRFFEDALQRALDGMEGLRCEFPKTREGEIQRSGYPDLKVVDEASGEVYYLDPKLFEKGSEKSSLRTFYFEPKAGTLKITEDAAHLLIGIEHDGRDGEWKFGAHRWVDLSGLKVRLKAEFQASNQDLYPDRSVLETSEDAGKDGAR